MLLCTRKCKSVWISHLHTKLYQNLSTSVNSTPNWLEMHCGDVPLEPKRLDPILNDTLKSGFAMQEAIAKILKIQLQIARRRSSTSKAGDPLTVEKLQEMLDIERDAVHTVHKAVEIKGIRFQPSLQTPVLKAASCGLSLFLALAGKDISWSYILGVKMALADVYNDGIRDLYQRQNSEDKVVKDLFKQLRDLELQAEDDYLKQRVQLQETASMGRGLNILDIDHNDVTLYGKHMTKFMLEVLKVV